MEKEMKLKQIETVIENETYTALYLYTPMCGTCKVAGRMVDVTEKLFPAVPFIKADLNYVPSLADKYTVESVPCLLLFRTES